MRMIIFLLLSIVTIELHAMASRMHAQNIFIINDASERIIVGFQGQGALHLSFFIDAGNNSTLVVRSNPPYDLNFTPRYDLNTSE